MMVGNNLYINGNLFNKNSGFNVSAFYDPSYMSLSSSQIINGNKTFGSALTISNNISINPGNLYVSKLTRLNDDTFMNSRLFVAGDVYLNGNFYIGTGPSINYLDSPATTSSTTYATFMKPQGGAGPTVTVQRDGTTSSMTLMEIAA
jgi:hypothetical protein